MSHVASWTFAVTLWLENQLGNEVKPPPVSDKYHGREGLRRLADRTDPGNCHSGRDRRQPGQREKRRITVHEAKNRPGDDRRHDQRQGTRHIDHAEVLGAIGGRGQYRGQDGGSGRPVRTEAGGPAGGELAAVVDWHARTVDQRCGNMNTCG